MIPLERSLPNTIIHSARHRYRILALLGKGGYGAVFKALRLDGLQAVAIKFSYPVAQPGKPAGDYRQQQTRQLQHEIALCATLRHAHIATLQDWGETAKGQVFAVFEYLPGQTLREHLLLQGTMNVSTTISLMEQVLSALAYLHGRGVIHCDIKPHNIMLPPARPNAPALAQVKLIDFGSALQLPHRQAGIPDAYRICSPAYSAPEQLRRAAPHQRFDIYAWGLVLLECLSGKAVIAGNSLRQLLHQQTSQEDIAIPAALLDHPLAPLLRQVLHKDERLRIGDTRLLQAQFRQLARTLTTHDMQAALPSRPAQASSDALAITRPISGT